mgnify:CR=1 FL=1
MHEPAIAAASVVSSVTPVAAQKICAPTAAFRMRYPIAHIAHVMAPPSALPCSGRGESAPAARHASPQHTNAARHKPRLYLRHQFAVHRKRSQPAQQQREPKSGQGSCRRAREHRQPFLFRIQKNTPCRTYASQHIPAGGESFRKQLYTSGPFGSSCFGSSFFVSFAFCLAALRSCASLAACASARAFVEMAHLATWMRT